MDEVIDIDAPPSTNGQAPAPEQRQLKDYSTEELQAMEEQMRASQQRMALDYNLIVGVLIGRGIDVKPQG